MKFHRKPILIVGGLALLLAAGTGLAGRALAEGPGGFGHGGRGGFGRQFLEPGGFKGAHDQALADALGVSLDKLQAAQEKVAAERLAQAVKDGKLTQEQADLMTAGRKLAATVDRQAIAAQVLGMSKAELQKALEEGQTLRELAEAKDLDRDTLQEKMQAAMDAAVADAVKAGTITQAQADALKEARDERGKGWGPMGGRGHGRSATGRWVSRRTASSSAARQAAATVIRRAARRNPAADPASRDSVPQPAPATQSHRARRTRRSA